MSSPVPESAAPLAIEARGLVKQFGGRRALDGLDLELPQGGFLSIFGPNGAGKTTLLRELALLARPTGGELRILGVDALEEPDVLRSRIGLISHKSMLYGDLTARENLAFFASLYGLEGPEAGARIDELLRLVVADHHKRAPVANAGDQTIEELRGMRIEARIRLVEQHELRVVDEGAGNREALLHAAGEGAHAIVAAVVELD